MIKLCLIAIWAIALGLGPAQAADERLSIATLHIDIAPTRVWQAFRHQIAADGNVLRQADHPRFEATLNLPEAGEIQLSADWDEVRGGTHLTWQPSTPASAAWMARLAARAATEPRDNYLCGGDHSKPEDLPEATLSGTLSCGESDAIHFLRHGYSTAWRSLDGSFYADPEWPPAQLN